MARSTDPTIKTRLLEQCLEIFVTQGAGAFSLRKIAEQIETSARMLIYHFGSAEDLFAEMIMAYSRREKLRLKAMLEAHPGFDSVGAFVEFYWGSYLTEQRRNVLIAFIEIYGQCLRGKEKYTGFFEEILFEWIVLTGSVLERHCGLRGSDTTAWATLIVAVCRGLLLDHLAAGETERIKAAVAVFQNMAESGTGG